MKSLIDNTGGSNPYAMVNLRGGGAMHMKPSLIRKIVPCRGFTRVHYGSTIVELLEPADKVERLKKLATEIEEKAKKGAI